MLLLGKPCKVTGTEKLNKKQAGYAKKEEDNEEQKYRIGPTAVIDYVHNKILCLF